MPTTLPVAALRQPGGVPPVCVRHAIPATRRKPVLFRSTPPTWSFLLILLGVLPFVIVATIMQKRVTVPNWPFCRACTHLRIRRLLGGIGMAVLGFIAVIGFSATMPPSSSLTAVVVTLSFAVLLAGVVFASTSGWATIAAAKLTSDGTSLRLRKAHPTLSMETD
ncbi:hypothetical protein O7600_00875 [Micromonospora sp. WMMA1998]|uniref:hypothetical protein n=1 Tax=Micromonospora sp. WMMA1998 TaxID=3015167 RepID=UPI00248B150D|nr:hypothetical protein [Micromonospora sp. WMMA1998]WBC15418.1 hypothetical protein O7600_00875 [Micromonospora sp. WMMA1998]